MSKRKPEKRWWRVAGFGHSGRFLARYAAGAVKGFARRFGRALGAKGQAIRTDPVTRGWKGISVEVLPR